MKNDACANQSAVSRQDFLDLYERCSDSGLRTNLILRYKAGGHEISISCRLSAPPSDANAHSDSRRRRRRCKRAPAAAAPSPAPPTLTSASSQPPSTPHEASPLSSTETISPPAKRTQKAAKRCCEVELLREIDSEEELLLSPVDPTRQVPSIDSPPSPMLRSSPAPSISLADSAVGLPATPPSPTSTPAASLLPAVSPVSQPPSPHSPTTSSTLPSVSTSWREVLCRKCHCYAHDISYRHCIECHFKENGYPSYYYDM